MGRAVRALVTATLVVVIVAPVAPAALAQRSPQIPQSLPTSPLTVVTASGEHAFTVEVADDPQERSIGLMMRPDMPRDHGMLFDFFVEGPRSFWMKNTLIPLDIVFARSDGTVVSVAKNTTPFSLEGVDSEGPARFVLEVNAGVADAIGVAPGDRIVHERVSSD